MTLFLSSWLLVAVLLSWLIYWQVLKSDTARTVFLVAASMAALAVFQWSVVIGILFLTSVTYYASASVGEKSGRPSPNRNRVFLAGVIVFFVCVLCIGRSGSLVLDGLSSDIQVSGSKLLPILGISYLVFRSLQYFFDSYRGLIREHSFLKLLHFLTFFPTFLAGPIETFQGFYDKKTQEPDSNLFGWGVRRMLLGYFKKLVILQLVFARITLHWKLDLNHALQSPKITMMFLVKMFFYAYIDISAYSDLAIGMSALFGYRIMENFRNPVFNPNLAQFWQSWHLSIVNWSRNQVYFPLFSMTKRPFLSLYGSMIMVGVWHQLGLNWLVWGFYHATGLILVSHWQRYKRRHRALASRFSSVWLKPPAYLFTFIVVVLAQAWTLTDVRVGAKLFYLALTGIFGMKT